MTRAAKRLVLVSAGFLLLQVASTDYGADARGTGAAAFWFAIGAVLLWLVYRKRSRLARGVVVVLSLFGAVLYGLGAFEEARSGLLALFCLGQALPLLAAPVREHVRSAAAQPSRWDGATQG